MEFLNKKQPSERLIRPQVGAIDTALSSWYVSIFSREKRAVLGSKGKKTSFSRYYGTAKARTPPEPFLNGS